MPMIMITAPITSAPPSQQSTKPGNAVGGVASTVSLLWASVRLRYRERLTRKILEALNDRTLHDIGIERSEITSIVGTRAAEHRVNYDHLY